MATVSVHYLRAIINCNLRKGFTLEQVLQGSNILEKTLDSDEARVPGEVITYIVKHSWMRLNDEFMGCTQTPCKHGVFELMTKYALNHDSLQNVLEQGIHFYQLFSDDIKMQLSVKANIAEFSIDFLKPELDIGNFFQEFWLMIWHRFASWVIGRKITLNQVYFPYPKPAHHQELKNAFPCRQNFNQSVMKISFNADYLNLPPVRTQRDLLIFLKDSPADLITIPGEEISYQAKIRTLILTQQQNILSCPDFELLAKNFNISSQTLRRKLKTEGTSYGKIKDDIRRDIAIEKLSANTLSIATIARSLGFSESRSFTRAFYKWTGHTPSDYKDIYNH
ncbi:MAG: AraC family transcriptional regulator ligand-binding domain-containing protein [Oceanospirillaceae bacterium]|nr:AraC family transcriptional regulator ligand-binding domain-containing protein [Oceanospirillaceae bacterium]